MSLGSYLKRVREETGLSLRKVESHSKEKRLGAELSSGYLSMLEQEKVKEPSPRILYALSKIYEIDYISLMKEAGYMPDADVSSPTVNVAFKGATRLSDEQRSRIQRYINFELNESRQEKWKSEE